MNWLELQDFLQMGLGMVLGTRDCNLRPEICTAMGVHLYDSPRQMTIYVQQSRSRQTLKNLQDNGRVALSLSCPSTCQAAQIKGRMIEIRPMTSADQEKATSSTNAYRKQIRLIGVKVEVAEALQFKPDIAIEVEIESVFIQTPGSKAGQAVELI